MLDTLKLYVDDENILNHVRVTYNGININGAFTGLPEGFNRRPAKITAEIKGYSDFALREKVSVLAITLPMM